MKHVMYCSLLVLACLCLRTSLAESPATAPTTRPVQAKPLSDNVQKGLQWLVQHQQNNGGWSQGEESANMGHGMDNIRDTANVADTCMAALALMRAGNTPKDGPYATNVLHAAEFVCGQVEKSDEKSLFITDIRGTRVQGKLGTYIDTFLAGLFLAEIKDHSTDDAFRKRVVAALEKTMDKIEKNQRPDGTWANAGWAPAIAQGMASKAINVAAQNGVAVKEEVRVNAEKYARGQNDSATGKVSGSGSAGVELYARASSLQAMQDSANTNARMETDIKAKLAQPTTAPAERKALEQKLADIKANDADLAAAQKAVVARMEDKQFIAGFGSNGGEEFLSYMNIGESLVLKGGEDWGKWDKSMTTDLNRIQNADGSWTGHHCITGRTFCTSAALMVLTVDRSTMSVAERIKRK